MKYFTNWTCHYWGITQGSYKTAEIASKSHDIAYRRGERATEMYLRMGCITEEDIEDD